MNTAFLLMAQYNAIAVIPVASVVKDYFPHLTTENFLRKVAMGRIWPHNSDSISTSFTRACLILGIEDLRFHDLRHEGVSRLFELGWSIPRVATVSGHRSWTSLKRYTHLRQTGDKYADWPWLARLGMVQLSSPG